MQTVGDGVLAKQTVADVILAKQTVGDGILAKQIVGDGVLDVPLCSVCIPGSFSVGDGVLTNHTEVTRC